MESTNADESLPSRVLKETELQLIENFVRLADALGIPKSLAQIYALAFVSPEPITAQDCVDCLKISRSSAGQGLKSLKEIGAIRTDFQLGARREGFRIEPDLGKLIQGILEGRIFPAFEDFFTGLDAIESAADEKREAFVLKRIEKLRRWSTKVQEARFLFSQ